VGNEPRMLNLEKADDKDKSYSYELLVDGGFADNTVYRIDFYDQNYNPTGNSDTFTVTGVAGDKAAGLDLLEGWLNTLPTPEQVVAVSNGKSIVFTVSDLTIRARITSNFSGTPSENAADVLTVPYNHYVFESIFPVPGQDIVLTDDHLRFMVAREKYQPRFRPSVKYVTDAGFNSNFVNRLTAQFSLRYIYDSGERSKWSAYSRITLPAADANNKIEVTFGDDWLDSSATLGLITGIDIAVRYSNTDPFRLVKTLTRGDLVVTGVVQTFDFYNDAEYPIVPSDGDGPVDVQILELFDSIPDISGTHELAANEDGSTLIVDGAVKLGFAPVLPDVTVSSIPAVTLTNGENIYKKNSRFQFGIVYAKRGGKRSAVNPFDVYVTPSWVDDGYNPSTIRLEVRHLPPADATHYYIVRKKNLSYQRWKPLFVDTAFGETAPRIEYGKLGTNEEGFTVLSFGDPDNTHVRFRCMAPWLDDDPTNDIVTTYENDSSQWFFAPSKGDRFRVILNYDSTFVTVNGVDDDYELDAHEYATVPTTGSVPNYDAKYVWLYAKVDGVPDYGIGFEDNFVVEIYTPRLADDGIYYEIDGGEIINGFHTITGTSGGQQTQTALLPAILHLHGSGDAYWRDNMTPAYPEMSAPVDEFFEVENAYRFTESKNESIGKPNVEDANQGSVFYADRMFVSDIFVQGAKINGLSSIRPLNYKDINSSYGIIKKLKMNGDVMLAICENRVQPIYVGKNHVVDLSGDNIVGRSASLLNLASELEAMAGTRNPESVFNALGATYFYDIFHGKWWRYNNGLYPISDYGMRKYFRTAAIGVGYDDPSQVWHPGGFDPKFDMPILKLAIYEGRTYHETWGFREEEGFIGFQGRFDFTPEMFCTLGEVLVSFRNGAVWHHNDPIGLGYCNFYGTQRIPSFTVSINPAPSELKNFWTIRAICPEQKICAPSNNSIIIPPTAMYGSTAFGDGMASRLKANKFTNYEGSWYAEFMRDINDSAEPFASMTPAATRQLNALLDGRYLRGYYLLVKMQPETPVAFFSAYDVSVEFTGSNYTKKK
jgi:hypothetical protein